MEGFLIDETTRTLALKTPVKSLDLGGREAGMYSFLPLLKLAKSQYQAIKVSNPLTRWPRTNQRWCWVGSAEGALDQASVALKSYECGHYYEIILTCQHTVSFDLAVCLLKKSPNSVQKRPLYFLPLRFLQSLDHK